MSEHSQKERTLLRIAFECEKNHLLAIRGFDDRNWKLCVQLRRSECTPDQFLAHPLIRRLWIRAVNDGIIRDIAYRLTDDTDDWIHVDASP